MLKREMRWVLRYPGVMLLEVQFFLGKVEDFKGSEMLSGPSN